MKDEIDERFVQLQERFAILNHVKDALISLELEFRFLGFVFLEPLVELFSLEPQLI